MRQEEKAHMPEPRLGSMAVLGLVFALSLMLSSVATAQPGAQNVWEQLQDAYADERGEGFTLSKWYISKAKPADSKGYLTTFTKGYEYLIIAACDDDCADVDLAILREEDDETLETDYEDDAYPVIYFTPDETARYKIETDMEECSESFCYYGFGVFFKRRPPKE